MGEKRKSGLVGGFYLSGSLSRQDKAKDLLVRAQIEHS
jgi:hypothetical protein